MESLGSRHVTEVGGVALHWSELGTGRPLVMLHGLSDSLLTWRRVAPALAAAGHRVLLVDLAGHGLSGRPDASYSLEWHAEIVAQWLDAIGVRELDLVGHSFGGAVAQQLLLTCPGRIQSLALIAPGGMGREVSLFVRALSVPGVDRLLQPLMQVGTRVVMGALSRTFADRSHRLWHAWLTGAPGTARALARTTRHVVSWRGQRRSVFDEMPRLQALPPIAVFWGRGDRVIPSRQILSVLDRMPGVTCSVFDRCGHFPQHEHPERLVDELVFFLQQAHPAVVGGFKALPARRRLLRLLDAARRAWQRCRRWIRRPEVLLASPEPRPALMAPRSDQGGAGAK